MAADSTKLLRSIDAMADLRQSLRKLERVRRDQTKQLNTVRLPGEVAQLRAVLVALISDDIDLACTWAAQAQRFTFGRGISQQASVGPMIMREWMQRWSGHPALVASLTDLSHPWREAADRWLIESLAVDHIRAANASGITVPGREVWAMLQRMWALRPASAKTKEWLAKLAEHAACRGGYLYSMRRRWLLHATVLPKRPGVGLHQLQNNAGINQKLGLHWAAHELAWRASRGQACPAVPRQLARNA